MTARFFSDATISRSASPLSRVEVGALALLSALLFYPAWLRGGTHAAWTWPLPWIAIGGWVLWLTLAARSRVEPRRPLIAWRDPVFWLGLLFLGLLLLQWWNAGRALYYDTELRAWAYSSPRHPALPSAITSAEARQMLDWFVPAWVILQVIRSPALSARSVRALWRVLVVNASIMAVFGLVQFLSGTTHMYWCVPMRPHFFASFGYPNHAGSYFLMVEGLAAGMLLYELSGNGDRLRVSRIVYLSAGLFLGVLGANFALSRASIILSWAFLLPILFLLARSLWVRFQPAQRVNLAAATVAVLLLGVLLTVGMGRDAIRTEFKPENDQKTFLTRETDFRWFQMKTAFHIWQDYPWYGVGGWGYRYLMAHYLPPDQWNRVTEGKANVHNDPLQFLAEFGLVGALSLGGTIGILVRAAFGRRRGRIPSYLILPAIGVFLVAGQSLIDLPFRSPAVLYLWIAILAGIGRARPIRQELAQSS
ncbi:MAG: O-antigen ligase family protein [Kiritimatiellae bacterium]|nr:O-antigen ligase family protein [Kiritimatiellia bacterium]